MLTIKDFDICAALAREARDLQERIQVLRAMAERTCTQLSHTPKGGGSTDRIGDAVASIDALERTWQVTIDRYLTHVSFAEEAINEVSNANQRMILRMRYLDGLMWEEISGRMHYSERWCRKLHTRGLKKLGLEKEDRQRPVNLC